MHGSTIVEGDHEGKEENTNITKFNKFLHILPKIWPVPIILKH
jgi:hypothetical protein